MSLNDINIVLSATYINRLIVEVFFCDLPFSALKYGFETGLYSYL